MDDADRAQVITEREREAILQAQRDAGLDDDEQIKLGAAVVCRDCMDLIDSERLRVKPQACRCLVCQTVHETQQQRQA